jgi:hypothetical protein
MFLFALLAFPVSLPVSLFILRSSETSQHSSATWLWRLSDMNMPFMPVYPKHAVPSCEYTFPSLLCTANSCQSFLSGSILFLLQSFLRFSWAVWLTPSSALLELSIQLLLLLLLLLLLVLAFELRASCFARQLIYHLSHFTSPIFIYEGFFKIGSSKLFARAGFRPWSSWVARIRGISHQRLALFFLLWLF